MNLASWFPLLEEVPLPQCTFARCYQFAPRGFGRTALGSLGGVYHEGVIGSVPCITQCPCGGQWEALASGFHIKNSGLFWAIILFMSYGTRDWCNRSGFPHPSTARKSSFNVWLGQRKWVVSASPWAPIYAFTLGLAFSSHLFFFRDFLLLFS